MSMRNKLTKVLNQPKLLERVILHLGEDVKIDSAYFTNDRMFVYVDAVSESYIFVVTSDDEVQIMHLERVNSLSRIRKELAIAEMIQTHLTMNKDWRE